MWPVDWCAALGARWCEKNKVYMRCGKALRATGLGEKDRRIAILYLSISISIHDRKSAEVKRDLDLREIGKIAIQNR